MLSPGRNFTLRDTCSFGWSAFGITADTVQEEFLKSQSNWTRLHMLHLVCNF